MRNESVTVWLRLVDDDDSLSIKLDEEPVFFGDEEDNQHWLQYCLYDMSLVDWLDLKYRSVQQWAICNGIAPGQRFQTRLSYWYSYSEWTGEHDAGIDYEIVKIEPWDNERILGAWSAWWLSYLIWPGPGEIPE